MFRFDDNGSRFGAMSVDNIFILDYLPLAGGDAVKVYLYALYCAAHPKEDMSVTELAHDLSMQEKDVEAALRYWERRHLITRQSDSPLAYICHSPLEVSLAGRQTIEPDLAYVAFSEDMYAMFGDRRKLRPAEISLAYDWVQDYGIQSGVVLMFLSDCIARRGIQFSFRSVQGELARMCEKGITGIEDAESYFRHSREIEDGARAVLRRFSRRSTPSQDEMDLYRKWIEEWEYTPKAILAACAETTKGEPTFAYLDGILKGIRTRAAEQNTAVRTDEDVKAAITGGEGLRAFAKVLGVRSPQVLSGTYQRLCQEHDPDLVLFAAEEARRMSGNLETAEKYLEIYKRMNLTTRGQAQDYMNEVRSVNRVLYRIFEACGQTGKPNKADRELYQQWREWGFSEEMMLLAAAQSKNADARIPYLNKVLEGWHNDGITTKEQVEKRKNARTARPAAASPVRTVSAQQYEQREYTGEELSALDFDIAEEVRRLNGSQSNE